MGKLKSLFRGEDAAKRKSLEGRLGHELSAKLIDHLGVDAALTLAENAVAEAQARWARFSARREELSEQEQQEYDRATAASGTVTIATRAAFITEFMAQKVLSDDDWQEYLEGGKEKADASPEERIVFTKTFVAEKIAGSVASRSIISANLPQDRNLYLDLGARLFLTLAGPGAVTVTKSHTPGGTASHRGVEFDNDGRVANVSLPVGSWNLEQRGQARYHTQRADSLLHATQLLDSVASVPENTYYVVETPDGALCRDVFGFYTEAPLNTIGLALAASQQASETVESVSLTAFGDAMKSQMSVAQLRHHGHYANFVLLMECGLCGYKSPVETQAGPMQRQCYCCGATNTTTRGNVTVNLGSSSVEI